MTIKHPQWILAVMREALTQIGFGTKNFSTYDFDKFVEAIEPFCILRQRNALEKDTRFPQLLPYAVPRQKTADGGWNYFPARRNRTGGEPKLWDLVTVAYAGHIDLADVALKQRGNAVDMSTVDVKETIIHATYRELCEELHVKDKDGRDIDLRDLINFTGNYINDDTVPVNTFHLAIMITIDIPEGATVSVRERESLDTMEPMPAWKLMEMFGELESWTGIFVKSLYKDESPVVEIPLVTAEELVALTKYQQAATETLKIIFAPMYEHSPVTAAEADRIIDVMVVEYSKRWIAQQGKDMPEPLSMELRGKLFAKTQQF